MEHTMNGYRQDSGAYEHLCSCGAVYSTERPYDRRQRQGHHRGARPTHRGRARRSRQARRSAGFRLAPLLRGIQPPLPSAGHSITHRRYAYHCSCGVQLARDYPIARERYNRHLQILREETDAATNDWEATPMPKLQTATLRPDLTRSDLEHLKFLEHSQKSAYSGPTMRSSGRTSYRMRSSDTTPTN